MTEALFDVVEVALAGGRVRLLAKAKTRRNAEAIRDMAVIRRGVDGVFYGEVPTGKYADGDTYAETEQSSD